jgi:hypothetical protein
MTFKHLFIEHERTPEEEAWVEEEIADQEERFAIIDQAMKDLGPTREKWYHEFHDRISTIGFNEDGDMKRVIPREALPAQPEDRQDRVVWKYGIDSDD